MDRMIEDAITTATDTGTQRREGWSFKEESNESQKKRRTMFKNLLERFLDEMPDDTTVAEMKEMLADGS